MLEEVSGDAEKGPHNGDQETDASHNRDPGTGLVDMANPNPDRYEGDKTQIDG